MDYATVPRAKTSRHEPPATLMTAHTLGLTSRPIFSTTNAEGANVGSGVPVENISASSSQHGRFHCVCVCPPPFYVAWEERVSANRPRGVILRLTMMMMMMMMMLLVVMLDDAAGSDA